MHRTKKLIIKLIESGKVVAVTKVCKTTKADKSMFSVGPYQTAVEGSCFAVIEGVDANTCNDASSAADEFISLVGSDAAWKAANTVGGYRFIA